MSECYCLKRMKKRKKRILTGCIIGVAVISVSATILYKNYYPDLQIISETQEYENIASSYVDKESTIVLNKNENTLDQYPSNNSDSGNAAEEPAKENNEVYEYNYTWMNFNSLKRDYKNIAAWITVANSVISYPVMYSDGNYYIDHDINNNNSYSGSIFAYNNQSTVPMDKNLVMYGHNLWNGAMFSYLVDVYNNGYVTDPNKNKVYLQTEEGLYIYEMFAAYKASINDDYSRINFISDEDFVDYCNKLQAKASGSNQNQFQFGSEDKIITMVTCQNGNSSDCRIVIHAKLINFTQN